MALEVRLPIPQVKDKAMLRNVVSQLIVSEKVVVTATVAKQLTALADRMVTYAKEGDVAARRQAAKVCP